MSDDQVNQSSLMVQIGSEEAIDGFRKLHPAFEACWHESVQMYEDLAPNMVYREFAWKLRDVLVEDSTIDCVPIMKYVETLMSDGTKEVQELVAVYFIEGLLAVSDDSSETMAPVLQMLSPLSRDYALAWNQVIGAQNKGLEK